MTCLRLRHRCRRQRHDNNRHHHHRYPRCHQHRHHHHHHSHRPRRYHLHILACRQMNSRILKRTSEIEQFVSTSERIYIVHFAKSVKARLQIMCGFEATKMLEAMVGFSQTDSSKSL